MADFRRCIFVLAVVALLLGSIPTASAQGTPGAALQCVANASVPPSLRSEGLTELVGDIVLNCTGGTPIGMGNQIPLANITIFLNTQVTSRLLNSSNQSEAILTIDEPAVGQTSGPQTCTALATFTSATLCTAIGTGVPSPGGGPLQGSPTEFKSSFVCTSANAQPPATCSTATTFLNANAYYGIVSGNSVTFIGVPIDPPGTTGTRVYRITNVRANATIPAPGGSGTPGQVIALISATPATNPVTGTTSTFPINNPTQIVGFVQTSLTTSLTKVGSTSALSSGNISILQCVGASPPATVGQLNYTELFPTAFKTRTIGGATTLVQQNTLGLVYNSESGYYNTLLAAPGGATIPAGLADYGTRLKAVFNNIPNGVSVFVSINNTTFSSATPLGAGRNAQLISGAEGTVGFTAAVNTTSLGAGPTAVFQVPIVSGNGTAVWEVTNANPLSSDTYSFTYFIGATASPATNSPAVGTGTVNMSYAPTPPSFTAATGAVASASLPIPRFIDTSTAQNVVSVTICRTNLLWPFVSNQGGVDTGLAISNTSTDPFGTGAQQGPCTLNFYGANAPAALTTASIASGTTYTTALSITAPNFQGYVIAVCNFQYAHGYAAVTDVGLRNFLGNYLALIIPDPPRSATAFPGTGGALPGEQLGY